MLLSGLLSKTLLGSIGPEAPAHSIYLDSAPVRVHFGLDRFDIGWQMSLGTVIQVRSKEFRMALGHASFDSTKQHLEEILHEVDSGFTQLPDFQRGWVWDDDHIKSLIASICTGYPIGAVMMLEVGESGAVFKPRRVEGTKSELDDIVPDRLILDGQQRLTSLFLALFNENPVPTKDARNKRIDRHYYIDINLAVGLDSDVEEAIVSVPAERQVRTFRNEMTLDVSSQELEFEHELFPADCVFKSTEWRRKYSKYWNYEKQKLQLFDQFEEEVLKQFSRY